MDYLEAVILGAVQGLTEFLPVSSSGHLEIGNAILGITGEDNLLFAMAVHGGTVLSTIVVFRKQILTLLKGFFKFKMNEETKFILKIFVSMIPILIVGLTLEDVVAELFSGNILLVGCMLLVTAALLWFSSVAKPRERELSYKDAFIIGIAQSIAVLPGLSRSGSTISTGLLLGTKRDEIAQFSFLMVLIPIIGANFLKFVGEDVLSSMTIPTGVLLSAFLSAFIVGTVACRLMLKLVAKGRLKWFALYCLIVGIVAISIYIF